MPYGYLSSASYMSFAPKKVTQLKVEADSVRNPEQSSTLLELRVCDLNFPPFLDFLASLHHGSRQKVFIVLLLAALRPYAPRLIIAMAEPAVFDGENFPGIHTWINTVSASPLFADGGVPEGLRMEYAFNHLSPDVRACIHRLESPMTELTDRQWVWNWERLQVALTRIQGNLFYAA